MADFPWLPVLASEHGGSIDTLILLMHILMGLLFVGWAIFFLYCVFRFRSTKNPQASYAGTKGKYSKYAEVGVVVAEAILLVFSVVYWVPLKAKPPSSGEAVEVRVVAQQFAWNIHYPGADGRFGPTDPELVDPSNPIGLDRSDPTAADDIVTINQLHLPVGRKVLVRLSSLDVIHSFALQEMRVKQDSIPGMEFPVYFTPTMTSREMEEMHTRTVSIPTFHRLDMYKLVEDVKGDDGSVLARAGMSPNPMMVDSLVEKGVDEVTVTRGFEISCAQLCGLGHYRMRGFLTIHEEGGFEAWLADQAADL